MFYRNLFELLTKAYGILLRPLVLKAVDDPETEWDDVLMRMLDALFRYEEE